MLAFSLSAPAMARRPAPQPPAEQAPPSDAEESSSEDTPDTPEGGAETPAATEGTVETPQEDDPSESVPEDSDSETAEDGASEPEAEANPFATREEEPEETEPRVEELPPALQARDEERAGVSPTQSRSEAVSAPMRVYGRLGVGLGIRLTVESEFQQERLAPSYIDLAGGVVLPGAGRLRHAFQLGVSGNLDGDGSALVGVEPFTQWVITPSYVVRIGLNDDPVPFAQLTARVGVPLSLSPDFSVGAEVAVGGQFMFLAGLGAYAELGYSVFFGATDRSESLSVHHLLAVTAGITIDFELLP